MTVSRRTDPKQRPRRWNALRSGYHAFSGLLWVAPRTPSLQLGVGLVVVVAVVGIVLRFSSVEIAVLILAGTLLLAVETLNTALEMLCDRVEPQKDPTIGKIKDVAAGATGVTEIGGLIAVAILLWHHIAEWIHI